VAFCRPPSDQPARSRLRAGETPGLWWLGVSRSAADLDFHHEEEMEMSSATGNVLIDRIQNLETAVFGVGIPSLSQQAVARIRNAILSLTGSADVLSGSGIYIVNSTGVDAMTLATPIAGGPLTGGPQNGQDGDSLTVYDAGGYDHTITTPANAINGNKHIVTFNGTAGSRVTLVAFNGVYYMFDNSGVTLS